MMACNAFDVDRGMSHVNIDSVFASAWEMLPCNDFDVD